MTTKHIVNDTNPVCNHVCQFGKFRSADNAHVCTLNIETPGSDCNFRGFQMKAVKTYLRKIEDPVAKSIPA